MGRDLHILPKFSDRWSHVYLEHGRLDKDEQSLAFWAAEGVTHIPIDQLGFLMLGPGTAVTHAAMRVLADNNCLVTWAGEAGVRLYAHSTGGTHHSRRLLRQAALFSDDESRMQVIRRMYEKRFPDKLPPDVSIESVRGMEGARVRRAYQEMSAATGVPWDARNYDQDSWANSDGANRALSAANSCLYGICHAAILSAGYSPAIGFIHVGKMLSFVYDIADLYKTEITLPIAFNVVKESPSDVERRARIACRDVFYDTGLMQRILPDIAEVLDAGDDVGESPGELEGRIISLADRAAVGRIPWESDGPGERRTVENGAPEEEGGRRSADLD